MINWGREYFVEGGTAFWQQSTNSIYSLREGVLCGGGQSLLRARYQLNLLFEEGCTLIEVGKALQKQSTNSVYALWWIEGGGQSLSTARYQISLFFVINLEEGEFWWGRAEPCTTAKYQINLFFVTNWRRAKPSNTKVSIQCIIYIKLKQLLCIWNYWLICSTFVKGG